MPTIPVAPHLRSLKPYAPGKPMDEVAREFGLTDIIKLASNENPLGPSPCAVAAMTDAARRAAVYPDGNAPALRRAVAQLTQMPEDFLVFGNGSDEILHLLCLTLLQPGNETVQGEPSFSMYALYAAQMNAVSVKVPLVHFTHDLAAMANAVTEKTRLVFVANPNNPTGTLVTHAAVERFLDTLPPHVLLVLDEAYDEYVTHPDKPDLRPHVRDGRNVILLRTFSKAYGLAGLRVGYGMAHPDIISLLDRVRSPFNVNALAQAAAAAAVSDQSHIAQGVAINAGGKAYFYREFARLGLEFIPSEANFVCVDVRRDSREVFDALLRRGVIVRAGYGLGLPMHLRVSIGTMPQNARFIQTLAEVLA